MNDMVRSPVMQVPVPPDQNLVPDKRANNVRGQPVGGKLANNEAAEEVRKQLEELPVLKQAELVQNLPSPKAVSTSEMGQPTPIGARDLFRKANKGWAAQSQADDINKRQAWWVSLLKDVIGYGAASGVVAATSGLAALTQPVFRTLVNMIHHAMSADKNGANSQDSSARSAWNRATGSLKRDLEAAWEVVTNAFNNPKKTLHEKLLKGSNAYKNWGHIGALMGGLIGGAGGPGAAFLGFLVGRYVGEAFGRVLSYATGNSGFTVEETVQQSLTLGLKGLAPEQAKVKVTRIEELRGEVEKAIKRCPSDQSLSADDSEKREELLGLADALESSYYSKEGVAFYDTDGKTVVSKYPWKNYIQDLRYALSLDRKGESLQPVQEPSKAIDATGTDDRGANVNVDINADSNEK